VPPSILSWTFHHPSSHKGRLFFKPNWPALSPWRKPAVGHSSTDTPTTPLLRPSIDALPHLGGAIPLLSVFSLTWQTPLTALVLPSLSFQNLVALAIFPPRLPPGIQIPLALMPSPSLPTLGSPLLGDILILTILQPGVFHTPSPMGGCLTTPLLLLIVGGTNVMFHSMGGISPSLFHTPFNMWGGSSLDISSLADQLCALADTVHSMSSPHLDSDIPPATLLPLSLSDNAAPHLLSMMPHDSILKLLHHEGSQLPSILLCDTANNSNTKMHWAAKEIHCIMGCRKFQNYKHILQVSRDSK
jgi:hypothetical protein